MMNHEQAISLFKWMTLINVAILVLSFFLFALFKKTVCRVHGRFFGIDESQVASTSYLYFGIYRLLVIIFNIVPYISLCIIF